MDLSRTLRTATRTGKVLFGIEQAKGAIEKKEAKLIVLAKNCPATELREQKAIPLLEFPGSNVELGAACGKPFSVSVLTVLDPGESQLLSS